MYFFLSLPWKVFKVWTDKYKRQKKHFHYKIQTDNTYHVIKSAWTSSKQLNTSTSYHYYVSSSDLSSLTNLSQLYAHPYHHHHYHSNISCNTITPQKLTPPHRITHLTYPMTNLGQVVKLHNRIFQDSNEFLYFLFTLTIFFSLEQQFYYVSVFQSGLWTSDTHFFSLSYSPSLKAIVQDYSMQLLNFDLHMSSSHTQMICIFLSLFFSQLPSDFIF